MPIPWPSSCIGLVLRLKTLRKAYAVYLFQGRFDSYVLDETHLLTATRYVEINPVKAGMIRSAEEYRWSSTRFHLDLVANEVLVKDKNLLELVENWEGYLRQDDEKANSKLVKAIRSGRPEVSSL